MLFGVLPLCFISVCAFLTHRAPIDRFCVFTFCFISVCAFFDPRDRDPSVPHRMRRPRPAAAGRRPRRLAVPEITPPEQMEIQACVHSRTQPHSPRSESSAASFYRKSPHPETHSNSGLCTIMQKRNKICTKLIRIGTHSKTLT